MKECLRCGSQSVVTLVGFHLINFVCDSCRLDGDRWDFRGRGERIPISIEDMTFQMTEPKFDDVEEDRETAGAIRAVRKYKPNTLSRSPEKMSIIWADRRRDNSRRCDMCSRHDCYYPVHSDYYREISKKAL